MTGRGDLSARSWSEFEIRERREKNGGDAGGALKSNNCHGKRVANACSPYIIIREEDSLSAACVSISGRIILIKGHKLRPPSANASIPEDPNIV